MPLSGKNKVFLFLQGPHGPFFYRLGQSLEASGAMVWRVGFNKGDERFWFHRKTYIPYLGPHNDWSETFQTLVKEKTVSDLVLYGDTRSLHAQAIAIAKKQGIRIHVFEEGYLRPYWITYERDGANGNSKLMHMSVQDMKRELGATEIEQFETPAKWGDMRQHIFYGMLYHYHVMMRNARYRNFRSHRAMDVRQEFWLYLSRLMVMPLTSLMRTIITTRIRFGSFPYHLVLLQLEHDASFQNHSPFKSMTEFLELTIQGFAQGAPAHHHLVMKAHPLEDGRIPMGRKIKDLAQRYRISGRVHFVSGGKLARLLDAAKTAVTVNSTAAQQVLWRGIPLKAFGTAVYTKPEFVSSQSLANFFSAPIPPDRQAYRSYRHYLLESSQIPGGFYSARGRAQVLQNVVDKMLDELAPYAVGTYRTATPQQQLRLVP